MSGQPKQDITASLSSLAMLSIHLREGKDYLDYLQGFVIHSLRSLGDHPFDAATVQRIVEQEFGLKIPVATFAIYLKRLVKAGTLSPVGAGLQYRVVSLPETNIEDDRDSTRVRIDEVVNELAAFAHAHYSLVWDDISSAAALAEFLRQYSIDFLKFAEAKSPLPHATIDKATTDYVVAAFIRYCAKSQPAVFESIKVLVQSHMLANALMCPDLEFTTRGFKDTIFFVDTRFVLKALDLESQFDTDNTRELLTTVQKLSGIVCIFPETKEEIHSVLKAIIKGMQQGTGRRGVIYRELMKRRRGVADVILAESNLEDALKMLSISTYPSPRYEEKYFLFQIGEDELRDEIEGEIDYMTPQAADHDVRVVRHIFALRKGRRASSIEDARFVFLTTNAALSRAAFNYERKDSPGWFFSAVVTDYHLSHLAWLKSPMTAAALPRTELLANCYATMKPAASFWNRYLDEVDRLKAEKKVSERAHEVLRFSLNAPEELMEVTRGEVEGINEHNLHLILERLERTYAADRQQLLEREQLEHEKTKAELAGAQLDAKARDQRRRERIDRAAGRIAKIAFYGSGAVFAAIAILALLGAFSLWYGIPAAVVGFLNLWIGFSGNTIERAVRRWIATKFQRFLE